MTSLDFGLELPVLGEDTEQGRAQLEGFSSSPLTFESVSGGDLNTWDHIFYYVGKPEEWTVKLFGNIFSDDPKYDWDRPSNPRNQLSLVGEAIAAGLPFAAAIGVGLAAALLNPFDPLNKIKLGALTLKGIAAKNLGIIEKSAGGLKGVTKFNSTGQTVVDTAKLKKKAALLRAEPTKESLKTARELDQVVANTDKLNDILVSIQRGGTSIDEIKLAATHAEQYVQGQRRFAGLTTPFRLTQADLPNPLSPLGLRLPGPLRRAAQSATGRGDPFAQASKNVFSGGLTDINVSGKLDAALVGSAVAIGAPILRAFVNGGRAALKATGFNPIGPNKALVRKMESIIGDTELDTRDFNDRAIAEVKDYAKQGYSPEYLLDALEEASVQLVPGELKHVQAQLLKEIIGKIDFKLEEQTARSIKFVDDTEDGIDTVRGSNIGAARRQLLVPRHGLTPIETTRVVEEYLTSGRPATQIGANEGRLSGTSIVIEDTVGNDFAHVPTDLMQGLEGVARYTKVQHRGASFLVARRLPESQAILPPLREKTTGVLLERVHLDNLEITAAQMADKGWAFSALSPSDLLITPAGGVQIINPDVFIRVPVGKLNARRAALRRNRDVLQRLMADHSVSPSTAHIFENLRNINTAERAAKKATRMLRAKRSIARPKGPTGGLLYGNTVDILNQAENAGAHRVYAMGAEDGIEPQQIAQMIGGSKEDFARANGIDTVRKEIQEAHAAGRQPNLAPIEVGITEQGAMVIMEGRDRLTAAFMEGLDTVNIREVNILGQKLDPDRFFVGTIEAVDTHFYGDPKELAGHKLPDLISTDYKLYGPEGAEIINPKDLKPASPGILDATALMISRQASKTGRQQPKLAAVIRDRVELDRKLVDFVTNEIAYGSDSLDAYLRNIEEMYGIEMTVTSRTRHLVENDFAKIKQVADTNMGDYARRGVFSSRGLSDSALVRQLAPDHIIEVYDDTTATLRIIGKGSTVEELRKFIREGLDELGVEKFIPFNKIQVVGSDGIQDLRVGELVTGDHPALVDALTYSKKIVISDGMVEKLAERGILFNATKERLSKSGLDLATGRLVKTKKSGATVAARRAIFSMFVTESGDSFIDVRKSSASNPVNVQREIFKEGPVMAGDTILVTSQEVVVSYPIGSYMDTLTKGAALRLGNRLHFLGKKLKALGLNGDLPVRVTVPWEGQGWHNVYGEFKTIDELAKEGFKLTIPDDMLGMPLDIISDAPTIQMRVRRYRGPKGQIGKTIRSIQKLIENQNDANFAASITASLPINLVRGYIHRVPTLDGERAFALVKDHLVNNVNEPVAKIAKRFMKGRTIGDFTPREINDFVREIRKATNGGKGEEVFTKALMDVEKTDRAAFSFMASAMDEAGIDFSGGIFQENPLFATVLATDDVNQAVAATRMVDAIKDHSGALSISAENLKELEVSLKGIGERETAIARIMEQITETDALILEAKASPDLAGQGLTDLEDKLSRLRNDHGQLLAAKLDKYQQLVDKHGPQASAIRFGKSIAYIDKKEAQELIAKGVLDKNIIRNSMGDQMVGIPIKVLRDNLPGSTRAVIFPEEVLGVVERFFGSANSLADKSAFVRLFDTVQDIWRRWTLLPVVGYHIRNALSDTYLAFLGGVSGGEPFDQSMKLLKLLHNRKKGVTQFDDAIKIMEESFVVNKVTGETVSYLDIWDNFVRQGGPTGGLNYNEFALRGTRKQVSEVRRLFAKEGLVEASDVATSFFTDNALLRAGQNVSLARENFYRLSLFFDSVQKGASFEEAGLKMKAVFYDYRDLNMFERSVMRRALPFYSWSRHNVPRMVYTMLTQPQQHLRFARAMRRIEHTIVGDAPNKSSGLPQWMREKFGMIVGKDSDGTWNVRILDYTVPSYEVFNYLYQGTTDPGRLLANVMGQTTPLLRVPVEQLLGQSVVIGPIRNEQPARSMTLSGIGFSRGVSISGPLKVLNLVVNEAVFSTGARFMKQFTDFIDRAIDDRGTRKPGIGAAFTDFMLGKSYDVDPEQTERIFAQRSRSYIKSLRRDGDRAMKDRDTKSAQLFYQKALELEMRNGGR